MVLFSIFSDAYGQSGPKILNGKSPVMVLFKFEIVIALRRWMKSSCHPAMFHPEHESSLGPEYPTHTHLVAISVRETAGHAASWYPSASAHESLILLNIGPKR